METHFIMLEEETPQGLQTWPRSTTFRISILQANLQKGYSWKLQITAGNQEHLATATPPIIAKPPVSANWCNLLNPRTKGSTR